MHVAALSSILFVLVQHVSTFPIETETKVPTLDVTLSRLSNTRIKAVVKNIGHDEVTFVHLNFFGDSAPVKKVSIHQNGVEVAFEGIKRRFKLHGLSSDALTSLSEGGAIEDEFDIATTSDLSRGGMVTLRSNGLVPLVHGDTVTDYLPYRSNDLTIKVDSAKASQVSKAIKPLGRRTHVSCNNSTRQLILDRALNNTVSLATSAAKAALSGYASKFNEYFKTTAIVTRGLVAARLRAVAKEANSTKSGPTTYYCADVYGFCETNVLAYTVPSLNIIANCGIYYSYLPALATTCHEQDQATTSLHEFTHPPGVYSPGTEDLAYGYSAATALDSSEAISNADNYALFANAINLGC